MKENEKNMKRVERKARKRIMRCEVRVREAETR